MNTSQTSSPSRVLRHDAHGIATAAGAQLVVSCDLAIAADNALRIGRFNAAVPEAELDAAIAALAGKITSKSRQTLLIGKAAYYRQAELSLAAAYDDAKSEMVAKLPTRDAQEGIAAFIDKRPPVCCHGETL